MQYTLVDGQSQTEFDIDGVEGIPVPDGLLVVQSVHGIDKRIYRVLSTNGSRVIVERQSFLGGNYANGAARSCHPITCGDTIAPRLKSRFPVSVALPGGVARFLSTAPSAPTTQASIASQGQTELTFVSNGTVLAVRRWQTTPTVGDFVFLGGDVSNALIVTEIIWDAATPDQPPSAIVWLCEQEREVPTKPGVGCRPEPRESKQ